jgi:hypothetical protein
MNTKDAMDHLKKVLKEDVDYRIGWQANIAMAFKDHWALTKKKEGESEAEYIHRIANGAADVFLEQLAPLNEMPENIDGMTALAFLHKKN